jgi:hypothetical protein
MRGGAALNLPQGPGPAARAYSSASARPISTLETHEALQFPTVHLFAERVLASNAPLK